MHYFRLKQLKQDNITILNESDTILIFMKTPSKTNKDTCITIANNGF